MLEGNLIKHNGVWSVKYFHRKPNTEVEWAERIVPLYPENEEEFREMEIMFDHFESRTTNQAVTFELVDEFTHPHLFDSVGWGDGTTCAKLINSKV